MVLDKKPTGYISEIKNLVPSCGKCNQSKGNKEWETWVTSDAKLSPKSRGIKDITNRIENLRTFENWGNPIKVDFESLVGKEKWEQHWENWEQVQSTMKHAQELATKIKKIIASSYAGL